jgi:hypothetical protein
VQLDFSQFDDLEYSNAQSVEELMAAHWSVSEVSLSMQIQFNQCYMLLLCSFCSELKNEHMLSCMSCHLLVVPVFICFQTMTVVEAYTVLRRRIPRNCLQHSTVQLFVCMHTINT